MVTESNKRKGRVAVERISRVSKNGRKDTAVRVSKWLDKAVEDYISDRKIKVEFPSKRNFVDTAVMRLLEEKGVNLSRDK